MEEGEERSAGFVLFRRDGNRRLYLLLRHRDAGHWAFPKGRIEPGEDALSAARRELSEETGIAAPVPRDRFRATSAYRLRRGERRISKTVVYFLGETQTEDVRLSEEHSEAVWLDTDGARRRLTYDEGRRILDEAETYLDGVLGDEIAD